MRENKQYHFDKRTGEYNCTTLAEHACNHFDDHIGDEVPERYYEIALEMEEQWTTAEKKQQSK